MWAKLIKSQCLFVSLIFPRFETTAAVIALPVPVKVLAALRFAVIHMPLLPEACEKVTVIAVVAEVVCFVHTPRWLCPVKKFCKASPAPAAATCKFIGVSMAFVLGKNVIAPPARFNTDTFFALTSARLSLHMT